LGLAGTVLFTKQAADGALNAAAAAQASAGVASQTLLHMEGSSKRQLRAYVSVNEAHFSFGGTAAMHYGDPTDHRLDFTLQFKNAGQTPAYGLSWWTQVGVALPEDRVLLPDGPPVEERSTAAVLGPGGIITAMDKRVSSAHEVESIKNGNYTAYIWGRVDYRDAFDTARYVNIFCIVRRTHTGVWVLQPRKERNDAN
jgi:hypothetical protein